MGIHNTAEDTVLARIHETFDEEERTKSQGYCTCGQCRLDVACYVLNRVSPEYVVSGRGVAHVETGRTRQGDIDLTRLIHEGIRQVNATKRPHFEHAAGRPQRQETPEGPVFNYPTILGRMLNGKNFEPMSGISLILRSGGVETRMVDGNWQNPCPLVPSTAGTFIFWPAPEKAPAAGAARKVDFELFAEAAGYGEFRYYFSVDLAAEAAVTTAFSLQRTVKLPDLFIFPTE